MFTSQFKQINWQTYFSFFQPRTIQQHISSDPQKHFIFLFLHAYFQQFKTKNLPQALSTYHEGEKEFDSFCTYRLAEIYNSTNNQFGVQCDKQRSWFYIIKSSTINILKYNSDFFNAKQKLMTLMAKNGFDYEGSEKLINKYQNKQTKNILLYSFRIVYGSQQEKSASYKSLLNSFQILLNNNSYWYLWDYLINIISSQLQIKNKNYEILIETLYKSTQQLSKYATVYYKQLSVMLMFRIDDNLIISKIRDNIKTLITLVKFFQFSQDYKDIHITTLEKNVLEMLKLVYQQINKIKILQDRVFFTFNYCDLLNRLNISSRQVINNVMEELQNMILIKSQVGFLGFFYYLKYKVYKNKQTLKLSQSTFQNQIQQPNDNSNQINKSASRQTNKDNQNNMMIYYYLGKIHKQLNQNQKYQSYIIKGYKLYQTHKQQWNELSFKQYYCYIRIKRQLKRINYNLQNISKNTFKFNNYYQSVTEKTHFKYIKKNQNKEEYKFQDIKILQIVTIQPYKIFIATVKDQLCTLVKYSFLSEEDVNFIMKELWNQKKTIEHQSILPIVNIINEELEEGFHNLYVVFPPCCYTNNRVLKFQQIVEECWKLSKAQNYHDRKLGSTNGELVRMYSTEGYSVLMRCLRIGDEQPISDKDGHNIKNYEKLKAEYPMEFITKQFQILRKEQLTEFFEQLYLNI